MPPHGDTPRDLGPQPIAQIMAEHQLQPHDLVAASPDQLTHKQVKRACNGRWLTKPMRHKLAAAINQATSTTYTLDQLFTY